MRTPERVSAYLCVFIYECLGPEVVQEGLLACLVALSCVPSRGTGGLAKPVSVSIKWA